MDPSTAAFRRVWDRLEKSGLLLLSDARIPSLTTLVADEPIRGSWWGHPMGRTIFAVSTRLSEHPRVLATKLVQRKVTFVHASLWPPLYAVATSHEGWQSDRLSPVAGLLLDRVKAGSVRTDRLVGRPPFHDTSRKQISAAATELETRLLVVADSVHTDSGAHAKQLESWERWRKRVNFPRPRIRIEDARAELERAADRLGNVSAELPWRNTR